MTKSEELAWPIAAAPEALEGLALRSGLARRSEAGPAGPHLAPGEPKRAAADWIDLVARRLGLEAEPVDTSAADLGAILRDGGPALLRLPSSEPRLLALLDARGSQVRVLAPDGAVRRIEIATALALLAGDGDASSRAEIEAVLDAAAVPRRRRRRCRLALQREALESRRLEPGWLLRLPAGAGARRQVLAVGLGRRLLLLAAAHAAQYVLWILSWWLLGWAVLEGRMERGWFAAWALLLLTLVPCRLLVTWLQGAVAVRGGAWLKQRLLQGVLRLEPEEVRHQGIGQLLGRIVESEAVESLALSGGLLSLVASIELVLASVVLATGATGSLHVVLLIAWIVLTAVSIWVYLARRRDWTDARLAMTHDLIEDILGHRTRLAQQPPDRWHERDDFALARYLDLSGAMDAATTRLATVMTRGWLVLAVAGLAPSLVRGHSPAAVAVCIGGTLLAYRALRKLVAGLSHLAGAAIAWKRVEPLFEAAGRSSIDPSSVAFAFPSAAPAEEPATSSAGAAEPILEAHDLSFRFRPGGESVLRGCSLQVRRGDRLLVEGHSGSGKSTLASLLTGLRNPEAGVLLLRGLDRRTVGTEAWRRRVVSAPQFHENHVLTETLAFNLLMGRGWPPRAADVREADEVCRELGLGDLLDRMPAGLLQMVGDGGWQLSHGERSRLYIARTLLQGSEAVILDESFGALDPESLERAMRCVIERAPTLLVIAHP